MIAFLLAWPWIILDYFLPAYARNELQATAFDIGLYLALFSITMAFVRPWIGSLVDHYGRRQFLIAGICCYILAILFYGLATGIPFLMIASVFHGLGSALFWIPAYAMVADLSDPSKRGATYGFLEGRNQQGLFVGTFMGFALIPFLEGLLRGLQVSDPFRWAWKGLFLVYALLVVYALFLGLQGLKGLSRPIRGVVQEQEQRLAHGFPPLLIVISLTAFGQSLLAPLLTFYLLDRFALPIPLLALSYVPAAIISAVLPAFAGRLADRIGYQRSIAIGLLASAVTFLLIPWTPAIFVLVLLWAIEAACLTLAGPAQQALIAAWSKENRRGTAYGYYTMAYRLGAALGPLLGGWIYDRVNPAYPFLISGALLLIGAGLILAYREQQERDERAPSL